jgi:hypothetical protein
MACSVTHFSKLRVERDEAPRRASLGISRPVPFRFSGLLKLRSQIEEWPTRQVFIAGNRKHLVDSEKRILLKEQCPGEKIE